MPFPSDNEITSAVLEHKGPAASDDPAILTEAANEIANRGLLLLGFIHLFSEFPPQHTSPFLREAGDRPCKQPPAGE
jgi:hypothetical protein